jgi:hypothetical protein
VFPARKSWKEVIVKYLTWQKWKSYLVFLAYKGSSKVICSVPKGWQEVIIILLCRLVKSYFVSYLAGLAKRCVVSYLAGLAKRYVVSYLAGLAKRVLPGRAGQTL